MRKVIDIFSRQVIKEQTKPENPKLDPEDISLNEIRLEDVADRVCSAAAKLVIECDLDTFEDYLEDLMRVARHYKNLQRLGI
jgi:hypothetical protein